MEVLRLALLLTVLSALCPPSTVSMDPDHPVLAQMLKRTKGGFRGCGQNLVNALKLVCETYFAKRGHTTGHITDEGEWSEVELGEAGRDFGGVWRSRSHAVGMFNRARRGVVNECCEKACSLDELRSYCLVPKPTEVGK